MAALRLPGVLTRLAMLLAGLALAVRIAVPVGFMPMADAAGRITLTLCSGTGAVVVPAMAHGAMMHHMPAPDAPAEHDSGHEVCPFGLLAAVADIATPLAPPPLAPLAVAPVLLSFVAALRPGLGLAAPPPPKTGPPPLD